MPPAVDNKIHKTLKKHDRLKSTLEIDILYRESQFIVSYPLKCYYSFSDNSDNKSVIRVAFTVPKKTFKHAVDRNLLKRRMREAYRLNYKTIFETFINQKEKQLKLFFIYIGKKIVNYSNLDKHLQLILKKICVNPVKSALSACQIM